jgi:ribosomal protein S18 acetylase RimI-like enzyme
MTESVVVRPLAPGEDRTCESILRALPDWFAIEDSIVRNAQDMRTMPTLVAVAGTAIVGFLTVRRFSPHAAEIRVLAVRRERHRRGIGRRLVLDAEAELRRRGTEYLHVKTRGPSAPDPGYDATRRFYEALGFRGIDETTAIWGPDDPCLLMVKRL